MTEQVLEYSSVPRTEKSFWEIYKTEGLEAALHSAANDIRYSVGTLRYTLGGVILVSSWMIWGSVWFGLMQKVFPTLMPLQLKEIGAPNQAMAILRNSIPALLGFVLVPIISFKSDRFRSRFGRRKPFILATAPFTVLFLISLAYVKDISQFMNAHAAEVHHLHISPMMASLVVIGFFIVSFMFFDDFVNSVGWYLIADVIPVQFMARFNAVSGLVGTGAGIVWNLYIFPHALSHTKLIYASIGILYFFGYGLMCLMVKEGQYPPVDPEEKRANRLELLAAFFRESFTHPLYISLFLFNALWAVTNACSTWLIFFTTDTLKLSLGQIGKIGAITTAVSLFVILPIGFFVDFITPVRGLILATILIIPATFASYFIFGYRGALYVGLIGVPINCMWDSCTGPMMIQMLPRAKYGQFSAANSMVRNVINIFIANIGAAYIDLMHNNYRMIFVWQCSWMVVALFMLLFVYYLYRKHGGPKNYVAPDPSFSGDESQSFAVIAAADSGST